MAGGVEDELERSEIRDNLGVDPVLIEEVQLRVDDEVAGRDEERDGKVHNLNSGVIVRSKSVSFTPLSTYKGAQVLECRLSESSGEVVVL